MRAIETSILILLLAIVSLQLYSLFGKGKEEFVVSSDDDIIGELPVGRGTSTSTTSGIIGYLPQ